MKKKRIPLIIILLIFLLLIMLIILSTVLKKQDIEDKPQSVSLQTDEKTKEKMTKAVNEETLKKIKGMSEQKRAEYYATQFLKYLQSRDTSNAYKLLNSEFKVNYFNTEESFDSYVKKYIPKEMNIKYSNMERLGNLYVLDVETHDILNVDNPNNFSFYIVIQENDYNDYELSFSVDKPMANSQKQVDSEE